MAGKRADHDFEPVTIGTDQGAEDGVQVLRTAEGRLAFVPRAVGRLSGDALEIASEIQEVVVQIRELQDKLESLVLEGRDAGQSWAVIGWCVGTTGDAARQRWGS